MYKQVFDYNGKPFLVKADDNGVLDEEDLKSQNLYQYTETMPPYDLYPPRQFDGENWHGASEQQFQDANQPSPVVPSQLEMIVAKLQIQVVKGNSQLKETEKQLANALIEISKLKGSVE